MKTLRFLLAFIACAACLHGAGTPTFDTVNGVAIGGGANTITLGKGTTTITLNSTGTIGSAAFTAASAYAPAAGSTSILTLGTIGTGTWQGSIIAPSYLGTGTGITTKYLRGDGTWQTVDTGLTVAATAITGGTSGRVLYNNAGVLGEMTTSGSGTTLALTTSPTFVTPDLGTPSALVGTNITGTASGLTAGNVTTNANLTGHVTSVGNAAVLGSFTAAQLSAAVSDGDPAYVGAANTFTTGQAISSTTSLLLGTAGSAVGNVGFRNATSGTTTLAPATGALGTGTVTLPLSGTLLTTDGSGASLTALNASNISSGTLAAARGGTGVSNTGTITLAGNLVTTGAFNTTFAQAATTTVTLPSTSATMARTDAAQTFTGNQTFNGSDPDGLGGLRASVSTAQTYVCAQTWLAPNIGSGQQVFMAIGKSASLSNWAGFGFTYVGNNSASNFFSVSFYGYPNVFSITRAGAANITGSLDISTTLAVTGTTTLSAALITTPEALAPALNAGAACGVTTVASGFALNGTNALTLANGTNGQIKTIVCTAVTAAGTATLTPTTCSGFTTVAFTAAGQTLTLQYFTTGGWVILSVRGATPA
jgi:hypothetical protein